MMQSYLMTHSWYWVLPNISPTVLTLRALYLISSSMKRKKASNSLHSQVGPFLSDHKLVSGILNIRKPPMEKKTFSVCKLKHTTIESF